MPNRSPLLPPAQSSKKTKTCPIIFIMQQYKYCPICKANLELKFVDERDRLVCTDCGWVYYRNPVPVIECLVQNSKGELLLIQRNISPCKGCWALPGGFLETDETLQEGGVRELREETGLVSGAGRLVGAHMQDSQKYGMILVMGMEFIIENEDLVPGDDAQDAKFFSRKNLPPVPFNSHRKLIEEFLQL